MKTKKIRELMVPREEYAMVSQDACLTQAIFVLVTHRQDETIRHHHRAVLVLNDQNRVVGKLSMHDIIKALEPRYKEIKEFDHSRRFGFSTKFIKSMVKDYNLWQSPMDDLCEKANQIIVRNVMYTPDEGDFVSIDATFNEAVHQLVVGRHQSLLVINKEQRVKGVLRLTDVFHELTQRMKPCDD